MPGHGDHRSPFAPAVTGAAGRAGPLAGIRVVDLSRYGPGPYCAMVLGDMGADVVVVDEAHAHQGKDRRPPMVGPGGPLGTAGGFMRRNCRRLALDLTHAQGRSIAQQLVAGADVLLEAYRPGTLSRLGLDPAELRRRHPRLVICSVSGFGQDGPHRSRPGHDLTYLARGGWLDANRDARGEPVVPATVVADIAAGGMQAVVGILAALLVRERTGEGQLVDVSLQEGVVALVAPLLAWLLRERDRRWTLLYGEAPWYGIYRTADDRHLVIAAVEPWFWERVCRVLGRPQWVAAQYETASWPAMRSELAATVARRPLDYWLALFEPLDACVEAVTSLDALGNDPQLRHRGTLIDVGGSTQVRPLPRLSATPLAVRRPPPPYGADTRTLLAELGLGSSEVARLIAAGIAAETVGQANVEVGR